MKIAALLLHPIGEGDSASSNMGRCLVVFLVMLSVLPQVRLTVIDFIGFVCSRFERCRVIDRNCLCRCATFACHSGVRDIILLLDSRGLGSRQLTSLEGVWGRHAQQK